MLLRICSDLHLEGFLGKSSSTLAEGFIPTDERDHEAVLVLAGDISSNKDQLQGFLEVLLPRFKRVIFVPGNHEFYKHDFHEWAEEMYGRLKPLVRDGLRFALHDVGSHVQDDVMFIYCTLWGDGGHTLADQGHVGFYLNDFRLITNTPFVRFTVQDMIQQYKISKKGIETLLQEPFNGKKVLITHHLPSRRLVSERFWPRDGSDGANGGFVGNCDDLLAKTEIAPVLWIHGHTHDTIDTRLWDTRIICNPAGYRGEWVSKFNTFMKPNEKGSREVVPLFVEI